MGIIRVVTDIHVEDGTEDKAYEVIKKEKTTVSDYVAHTILAEAKGRVMPLGDETHLHDSAYTSCSVCSRLSSVDYIGR